METKHCSIIVPEWWQVHISITFEMVRLTIIYIATVLYLALITCANLSQLLYSLSCFHVTNLNTMSIAISVVLNTVVLLSSTINSIFLIFFHSSRHIVSLRMKSYEKIWNCTYMPSLLVCAGALFSENY